MYYIIDNDTVVERHAFETNDSHVAGRIQVECEEVYPLFSKRIGNKFYAYPGSQYTFDVKLLQWVFNADSFRAQQKGELTAVASHYLLLATEDSVSAVKAKYAELLGAVSKMASPADAIDYDAAFKGL